VPARGGGHPSNCKGGMMEELLEGQIVEYKGAKYMVMPGKMLAEIAYFQKNLDGTETPVLKTQTINKDEGYDSEGNPKRSVEIRVPCLRIGMVTGDNG
jgi:hypothetical protein